MTPSGSPRANFYGDTSVGNTDPAGYQRRPGEGSLSPYQMSQYTSGKMGPGGLSAAIGFPSQEQAGQLAGHSAMPGWQAGVNAPVQRQTAQLRQGFANARQIAA